MGKNGRTLKRMRQTPSRGNSEKDRVMNESIEAPVAEQVVEEKTLPVSRVNEIVKREKLEAAEKARQEVQAEYAKKMEELQAQQMQSQQSQVPSVGGMAGVDAESIKKQVMDQIMAEARQQQEAQQQEQHQKEMERVAGNFFTKMGAGKEMYPDFEEVTSTFNPSSFPQLVFLAAEMENTPDIMYELAKNPQKLATIDYLAQRDPMAAKSMLGKLSDSITQNKQAAENMKSANAPLSRLKSSTVGADNGVMGLSDLKKAPWLRG